MLVDNVNPIRLHLFICILHYCIYVVTTCPKMTAPQLRFNFRMKSKKLFCCYALHCLNYFFYRHHWNTLYQIMNMVFIFPYFNKHYFIPTFNIFTNIYQALLNGFIQYASSIFYRANQMIQQQTLSEDSYE